jgi:hypothetical protein
MWAHSFARCQDSELLQSSDMILSMGLCSTETCRANAERCRTIAARTIDRRSREHFWDLARQWDDMVNDVEVLETLRLHSSGGVIISIQSGSENMRTINRTIVAVRRRRAALSDQVGRTINTLSETKALLRDLERFCPAVEHSREPSGDVRLSPRWGGYPGR